MPKFITIILPAIFLTLIFYGCESKQQKALTEISAMSRRALLIKKQQSLLKWYWVIEGKKMELAETYANHKDLFSPASIQFVKNAMQQTTNKKSFKELRYFKNFLIGEFLNMHTARFQDRIMALETAPLKIAPGKNVNFNDIERQLAESNDNRANQQIFQAAGKVSKQINQLRDSIYVTENLIARAEGYPSAIELTASLHNFGPQQLYATAGKILETTDSLYQAILSSLLKRHFNIPVEQAHLAYLYAIRRQSQLDSLFTPGRLIPSVDLFLDGLGIRLSRQSFLTIDSAARPEKAQAVFCAVVDVPEDIRLSFKPTAGFSYYAQLFHQMGYAQFALFNNSKSPVFQRLYESPVREVFSLLFEKIWEDSSWTNRFMYPDTTVETRFYKYLAFEQLLKLRMAAATIRFEIDRKNFVDDAGGHFQEAISRAILIPLSQDEVLWLRSQQNGFFGTAVYLQGSILEAHLRDYLKREFERRWYKNTNCGKYLKSMWSRGNDWSIPEFMKKNEIRKLDTRPLIQNINSLLNYAHFPGKL